ncbi:MAG: hypothetical protein ACLQRH_03650 [Acidimicrobiales bacterium]
MSNRDLGALETSKERCQSPPLLFIHAGRSTFGNVRKPPSGRYAEQWRAGQTHRPSTAVNIETNLRRHVYPQIGNRSLASIRRSEIQAG